VKGGQLSPDYPKEELATFELKKKQATKACGGEPSTDFSYRLDTDSGPTFCTIHDDGSSGYINLVGQSVTASGPDNMIA